MEDTGIDAPHDQCPGAQPCNSYTCSCGAKFTVCAYCVGGRWQWPIDDNCHFACPPTPPARGCAQPLPAGFDASCGALTPKAGSKVCTDEMLVEIATCFGPSPDAKRCAAIQAAAPECAKCTLTTWAGPLGVDEAACVARVDGKSDGPRALQCGRDCVAAVCSFDDCDTTPGSGSTSDRSQWRDCYETAQSSADGGVDGGGACATFAARRAACLTEATAACFPKNADDLLRFWRGACRDGGDWSKVGDAGVGDAAPDADAASDASGD